MAGTSPRANRVQIGTIASAWTIPNAAVLTTPTAAPVMITSRTLDRLTVPV
jgi:hypothetical protein